MRCGLGRQYLLAAIEMGVLLIVIDTAQDWTQSVWKLLISLCDSSDDLEFIATHAFAAPSGKLKKCKIKFSVYNSLLIYETNSVLGKHYVKVFRKKCNSHRASNLSLTIICRPTTIFIVYYRSMRLRVVVHACWYSILLNTFLNRWEPIKIFGCVYSLHFFVKQYFIFRTYYRVFKVTSSVVHQWFVCLFSLAGELLVNLIHVSNVRIIPECIGSKKNK